MSASEYRELYNKYKAAQDELSDCTAKMDRMFIALVDAGGEITQLEALLLEAAALMSDDARPSAELLAMVERLKGEAK